MSVASTSSRGSRRQQSSRGPAKDSFVIPPTEASPGNLNMSSKNSSIYTRQQCKATNGRDCPIADCLIHHRKKKTKRMKHLGDPEAEDETGDDLGDYSSDDSESEEEEEEEKPQVSQRNGGKSIAFERLTKETNSSSVSTKTLTVSSRATNKKVLPTSNTSKKNVTNGRVSRSPKKNVMDVFSSDDDEEEEEEDRPRYQRVIYHVTEFVTMRSFSKHPYIERITSVIDEVTPKPVKDVSRSIGSWIHRWIPSWILWLLFFFFIWSTGSYMGILPTASKVANNCYSFAMRSWSIICCLWSSISLPSLTVFQGSFPFIWSTSPSTESLSSPVDQKTSCHTCPPPSPQPQVDHELQARLQSLEARLAELLAKESQPVTQTPPPVDQPNLESLVKEAVEKSSYQTRQEILSWLQTRPDVVQQYRSKESESNPSGVTLADVERMILLYDADKTGVTDYAFEPSGGTIVSKHCSETYDIDHQSFKLLGIPIFSSSNSPRKVIQAGTQPGDCWAFPGSNGYVTIRLARKIIPTSFSMEHAQKRLMPDASIDSAPKSFSVYGLITPEEVEGDLLGRYEYQDLEDQPLQSFPIQLKNPRSYEYVRLHINSNHGNAKYTCVYRFRVHGRLPSYT